MNFQKDIIPVTGGLSFIGIVVCILLMIWTTWFWLLLKIVGTLIIVMVFCWMLSDKPKIEDYP